jgi:hypothetical protein
MRIKPAYRRTPEVQAVMAQQKAQKYTSDMATKIDGWQAHSRKQGRGPAGTTAQDHSASPRLIADGSQCGRRARPRPSLEQVRASAWEGLLPLHRQASGAPRADRVHLRAWSAHGAVGVQAGSGKRPARRGPSRVPFRGQAFGGGGGRWGAARSSPVLDGGGCRRGGRQSHLSPGLPALAAA